MKLIIRLSSLIIFITAFAYAATYTGDGMAKKDLSNATVANGGVVFGTGTSATVDAAKFFWDNTNKNLGLGSATPVIDTGWGVLTIKGTNGGEIALQGSTGSTTPSSSQALISTGTLGLDIISYGSTYQRFFTNNAERMRIDSAGNIGISNTGPLWPLDFSTSQNGTLLRGGTNSGIVLGNFNGEGHTSSGMTLSSGGSWTARNTSAADINLNAGNSGVITFSTDSSLTIGGVVSPTERMRLDSTGKLGIGGTPSYKLDLINGSMRVRDANSLDTIIGASDTNANTRGNIFYDAGTGVYKIGAYANMAFGTNTTNSFVERMRIDNTGAVGINGAATGTNKLHVVSGNTRLTTLSVGRDRDTAGDMSSFETDAGNRLRVSDRIRWHIQPGTFNGFEIDFNQGGGNAASFRHVNAAGTVIDTPLIIGNSTLTGNSVGGNIPNSCTLRTSSSGTGISTTNCSAGERAFGDGCDCNGSTVARCMIQNNTSTFGQCSSAVTITVYAQCCQY